MGILLGLISHPAILFAWANLKRDFAALWSWLCHRSFWQLVSMALALFVVVQHFELIHARHEAASWHNQFTAEHLGRLQDRAAYVKAQADAAATNKAHVEAENKHREQISETSRSDFVSQRDRLRSQSGAAQGFAGAAGVSQVPHAAPGTPQEVVSLPPAELLRAQEAELELNALIDWVQEQMNADPKPPSPVDKPHG